MSLSIRNTSSGKDVNRRKSSDMDEEAAEKEPNGSFAWKVLVPSKIKSLSLCETPEDLEEKMSVIMDFQQHNVELKEACQLDYFVTAFHWAKEKNFDDRQLSGFITLVSNLMENLRDQGMRKSENLTYLKECFSGVGFDNPDILSVPLYFFKLEDAKLIMQYLISTFFYHYSLYQYLFFQQQDELIIGSDLLTETCPEMAGPFPVPLEEGIPSDVYDEFVVQHNAKKALTEEELENLDTTNQITEAVLKAVEASDDEIVKSVSTSELRKVIEKITHEMILPAKADLQTKIKDKETSYLTRINKISVK